MSGRAAHPLRKANSIKTRQAPRITFFSLSKLEACNHALLPGAKKNARRSGRHLTGSRSPHSMCAARPHPQERRSSSTYRPPRRAHHLKHYPPSAFFRWINAVTPGATECKAEGGRYERGAGWVDFAYLQTPFSAKVRRQRDQSLSDTGVGVGSHIFFCCADRTGAVHHVNASSCDSPPVPQPLAWRAQSALRARRSPSGVSRPPCRPGVPSPGKTYEFRLVAPILSFFCWARGNGSTRPFADPIPSLSRGPLDIKTLS